MQVILWVGKEDEKTDDDPALEQKKENEKNNIKTLSGQCSLFYGAINTQVNDASWLYR